MEKVSYERLVYELEDDHAAPRLWNGKRREPHIWVGSRYERILGYTKKMEKISQALMG